jgi:hypothetical protein
MAIFILFIFIIMPFLNIFVSADNEATINIHMIRQDARYRLNNPIVVGGLWHYINVTPSSTDFQELNLKLYKGSSMPSSDNRDKTNYYEWEYSENLQEWTDVESHGGFSYMNTDLCQKNSNTYSFCIGVSPTVVTEDYYYLKNRLPIYYENFSLKVYADDIEIYSGSVVIEEPMSGISKPHGDFIRFYVAPFTVMEANGDDYIKIENTGNTPLVIDIDYGNIADYINIPNLGTVVPPFSTLTLDGITLDSKSWKPGTIEVKGKTIDPSIPGVYIMTSAQISLLPVPGIQAPVIEIIIGRDKNTYNLFEYPDSDITFQYPKEFSMAEGETKEISVFISGDGFVSLDLTLENLKLITITYENKEVETPVIINSRNTSEFPVKIKFQALRENIDANIIYYLTYDGETKEFRTEVTVGPPDTSPTSEGEINLLQVAAIVGIFVLIILYLLNTRRKHNRRY